MRVATNVSDTLDSRFGKVDSRLILDVSARYAVNEKANVFLNLHNLLDKEYMASRHPYGPRPGQPFSAMFGVEVTF
ncbi:MAG: TonB-dependent receptor [Kiritimatiellae bacterium]|nr:TonB-dependent receptor [Kiritimatiellia bacterium]